MKTIHTQVSGKNNRATVCTVRAHINNAHS